MYVFLLYILQTIYDFVNALGISMKSSLINRVYCHQFLLIYSTHSKLTGIFIFGTPELLILSSFLLRVIKYYTLSCNVKKFIISLSSFA